MTLLFRSLLGALALMLALVARPSPASAQPSGPLPTDIAFEPHLSQRAPLEAELADEAGRSVRLGDYFTRGKPVILVLAYYECPMLCSMVLNGVVAALRANGLAAGDDFELVVVSIDPADTSERAQAKKASYVRSFDRPGADAAFHFLTGREQEVRRVADAVGFKYVYDAIGHQFAHPAGIVLLTPSGVISRYLYGVDFSPRDLRLGLVEAGQGAIGKPTDRLMLLCFRYDPERGRYGAIALASLRIAGVITLVILGISLVIMNRRGSPRGSV